MNYQNAKNLAKQFKPEKGWEIVELDYELRAVRGLWMVDIDVAVSRYNDGCGYPYIDLKMWFKDEYVTLCSFDKISLCKQYMKEFYDSLKV